MVALEFRDLDDPTAGGSEVHLHEVLSRWAASGLEVHARTPGVPGAPRHLERSGYTVERVGSRLGGVVRATAAGALGRLREFDAVVEVWNGVPFWTPLWWRGPRLVLLHHLHDRLWPSVLPASVAPVGSFLERRVFPYAYRRGPISTLSLSSRNEILARTPLPASALHVNGVGVAERFAPGGTRHERPTVLVVGRLTPAKRVEVVVDAMADVVGRVDGARLVIVGEGPELGALADRVRRLRLDASVELLGSVDEAELLRQYRSAWVVASASESEGWGMTMTEAGACGTPSVVTDIVGHADAVPDGTGLRVPPAGMAAALTRMLSDERLRAATGEAALVFARSLTWDRVAGGLLSVLVADARSRQSR